MALVVGVAIVELLIIIVLVVYRTRVKPLEVLEEWIPTKSDSSERLQDLSGQYMRLIGEFAFSVEELQLEMKEVLARIETLTAYSEEQSAGLHSTGSLVERVYGTVDAYSERSAQLAKQAEEGNRLVAARQSEIRTVADEFENLRKQLESSSAAVNRLGETTEQADGLIQSIDQISSQTNLLALNASIEAARAGENGRGFAVVADEVRKLSVQTAEAVHQITGMMRAVISIAHDTREGMDAGILEIARQSEMLKNAARSLGDVERATREGANGNHEFAAEMGRLRQDFGETLSLVQNLAIGVEEAADTAVEIGNSVEEENRSVEFMGVALSKLEDLNFNFNGYAYPNGCDSGKKRLVLATSPYAPYILYNRSTNAVEGIDVDILREIYSRGGIEVVPCITPWDTALRMIREGACDLIPNISRDSEREKFMAFSASYRNQESFGFYVKSDSSVRIERYSDLKGRRIGSIQGYSYFPEFDREGSIIRDPSLNEAILFKKLQKGQLDAVIMDCYSGDFFLSNMQGGTNIVRSPYVETVARENVSNIGFTRCRDMSDAIRMFDEGFAEIKKDGTLDRIVKKYI